MHGSDTRSREEPDGRIIKQIDYIIVDRKCASSTHEATREVLLELTLTVVTTLA